jgi:hypothetical protein
MTRPLRRPPIVLAAGQVWRAADGTERTILALHEKTMTREAGALVGRQHGPPSMLAQITMRSWISQNRAQEVSDAG